VNFWKWFLSEETLKALVESVRKLRTKSVNLDNFVELWPVYLLNRTLKMYISLLCAWRICSLWTFPKSMSTPITSLYSLAGSWIEGYFLSKTDYTSGGACEWTDLPLQEGVSQCKSCDSIPLRRVQSVEVEIWNNHSFGNDEFFTLKKYITLIFLQ
jgi:hypothetical protein